MCRSRELFPLSLFAIPARRCFITVTRARAKGQLGEQSIHLVSPLLGSCGAGEGQSEAEGISKPLCLLDLSVTLCSLSVKSLSLSFHCFTLQLLSDLTILSLSLSSSPSPFSSPFSVYSFALGMPANFPLAIFFSSSFLFVCVSDST